MSNQPDTNVPKDLRPYNLSKREIAFLRSSPIIDFKQWVAMRDRCQEWQKRRQEAERRIAWPIQKGEKTTCTPVTSNEPKSLSKLSLAVQLS